MAAVAKVALMSVTFLRQATFLRQSTARLGKDDVPLALATLHRL